MNADASRLRLHIAQGVLTLLALTALTVGLAALLLGASTRDLLLLALFVALNRACRGFLAREPAAEATA